jgi:hypothetical protein
MKVQETLFVKSKKVATDEYDTDATLIELANSIASKIHGAVIEHNMTFIKVSFGDTVHTFRIDPIRCWVTRITINTPYGETVVTMPVSLTEVDETDDKHIHDCALFALELGCIDNANDFFDTCEIIVVETQLC